MKLKLRIIPALLAMLIAINLTHANSYYTGLKYCKVKKEKRSATAPMTEKPFNIKLNVMALGLRNISLFGEYAFHKNMSAQLGFRFMMPYNLPLDPTPEITGMKLNGWALTPEFRFYPGKHEDAPAPDGFYIGLYGRYSKLSLDIGTTIDDPINIGTKKNTDFKIGLSHLGGGIILGRQWAKNAFSVDWWILAGGAGISTLEASVSDPIFKNQTAADEIVKAFGDSDNALFSPNIDVNTNTGTIKITQSSTSFHVRSLFLGGLCFGYHF